VTYKLVFGTTLHIVITVLLYNMAFMTYGAVFGITSHTIVASLFTQTKTANLTFYVAAPNI